MIRSAPSRAAYVRNGQGEGIRSIASSPRARRRTASHGPAGLVGGRSPAPDHGSAQEWTHRAVRLGAEPAAGVRRGAGPPRPARGSPGWRCIGVRLGGEDVPGLAVAERPCRVRLREVVDARRTAADRLLCRLARSRPGVESRRSRGSTRIPCASTGGTNPGRPHEGRSGGPLGSRLISEQLGDVEHARIEPRLLVRAATRRVYRRLRRRRRSARPRPAPSASPPPAGRVEMERAATGWFAGVTTSYPSAASTRAVAALTSPKMTLCTQPVSNPTRPREAPAAGVTSGGCAGNARAAQLGQRP